MEVVLGGTITQQFLKDGSFSPSLFMLTAERMAHEILWRVGHGHVSVVPYFWHLVQSQVLYLLLPMTVADHIVANTLKLAEDAKKVEDQLALSSGDSQAVGFCWRQLDHWDRIAKGLSAQRIPSLEYSILAYSYSCSSSSHMSHVVLRLFKPDVHGSQSKRSLPLTNLGVRDAKDLSKAIKVLDLSMLDLGTSLMISALIVMTQPPRRFIHVDVTSDESSSLRSLVYAGIQY